ncbi:MAG: hypothetical protein IJI40_08550 [Firmicutes bacterium]|nr:hypothetical protein [Bacillota bacterium]
MDTVWVDTMFPGIDPDEGWEKNLERVVNYDYLLKEYLDWQLKHLTVDNMDPVDWAKVEADIISMAAKSVDLTAYYTKDEADNKSQLLLQAAEDYTQAQLASYYTASEVDSAISTQAGLTLTAAEGYVDTQLLSYYTASQVDGAISAQAVLSQQAAENYTNTQLGSYYTKTEIGDFTGYQTAVAALQAYADSAVASIDLSAYYTSSEVDGVISASEATVKGYADGKIAGLSLAATGSGSNAQLVLQSGGSTISGSGASLAMSVSNNSNGYSTVSLTSGGITLATSGNITLGGAVMFTGDNISRLNNNSGYQTSSGVTTIIGDTVTTSYINALNVTAKTVKASASISSPAISGGTITGGLIVGSTFYSADQDSYFSVGANGWSLYQKSGSSWYERAALQASSTSMKIVLGSDNPKAVFEKYFANSTHYLWLGDLNRNHGLLINLSTGAYSFS